MSELVNFKNTIFKVSKNDFSVQNLTISKDQGLIIIDAPNGAGKTMFINFLIGIFKPKKGEIKRFFKPKEVVYIPDEVIDLTEETFKQNAKWILGSIYSNWDSKEYFEICEKLSVNDFQDKKTKELSFGTRRKLNIMPIFSKKIESETALYILDEIFTGLDNQTQEKFKKRINDLLVKRKTILIIEHNRDLLNSLTTREYEIIKISEKGEIYYEK